MKSFESNAQEELDADMLEIEDGDPRLNSRMNLKMNLLINS